MTGKIPRISATALLIVLLAADFEQDRSPCLFLDHGATVSDPAAGTYVVDLQTDDIATSELAVDREVEQGKISFPALQLKPNPNGPDIFSS
jgi:hypothetical protein